MERVRRYILRLKVRNENSSCQSRWWHLFRDGSTSDTLVSEEFPRRSEPEGGDIGEEAILSEVREFLLMRGERIISIASDHIYTEPIPGARKPVVDDEGASPYDLSDSRHPAARS